MTTTPEQFLALLTGSREDRYAAPCVPPGGQIVLRRDGHIERAVEISWWEPDGSAIGAGSNRLHYLDCIATLDLASVLAEVAASRARIKELERGVLDGLSQWGQDHQGVDG